MEHKYQALVQHARRHALADAERMALCFSVLSLAARIDRDCAAQLAPHGLSEARFVLLFLLESAGTSLAPHVLAERAGISRASITHLLDGLQRDGLIQRLADPDDRRALRICLTNSGKRLARKLTRQHSRWIAGLFSALSNKEQMQLQTLLHKAAQSLEHRT